MRSLIFYNSSFTLYQWFMYTFCFVAASCWPRNFSWFILWYLSSTPSFVPGVLPLLVRSTLFQFSWKPWCVPSFLFRGSEPVLFGFHVTETGKDSLGQYHWIYSWFVMIKVSWSFLRMRTIRGYGSSLYTFFLGRAKDFL